VIADFLTSRLDRSSAFFESCDLSDKADYALLDAEGVFERLHNLSILKDDLNDQILKRYISYRHSAIGSSGIYRFQRKIVFDNWGLVYCPEANTFLNLSDGFGWPKNAFEFLKAKGFLNQSADGENYRIEYPGLQTSTLSGTSALLTFPGALTFGHWIIDIWGRIEILKRSGRFYEVNHFIFPAPIAPWMRNFFDLFEIESSRIKTVDKTTGYICEDLLVPTVPSQLRGGVLPHDLSSTQFSGRARFLRSWFPKQGSHTPAPLFLKHRHLTSNKRRLLTNAEDVANLVLKCGGGVLDPVGAPIGEVIAAIQDASIVIGQDSSALHNNAFVGRDVLIIQTEQRNNLLHLSIQDALNAKFAYIQSEPTENGWFLDTEFLGRFLNRLIQKQGEKND